MVTASSISIPLLESGDRLTRQEFERRYQAMVPHIRAELIEGVAYVASPVRAANHGRPHAQIMAWLGFYYAATPGIDIGDNTTVRLDLDNEPQPDAYLRLEIELGGQSRISDDDYIEGAPELIVEVASSSASYDLTSKRNAYRRNGVQEYMVWQIYENRIDWFQLHEGQYVSLLPNAEGILCSQVFPGLWLEVTALLQGDLAQVLATIQQGLERPEHQGFVQHLQNQGSRQ